MAFPFITDKAALFFSFKASKSPLLHPLANTWLAWFLTTIPLELGLKLQCRALRPGIVPDCKRSRWIQVKWIQRLRLKRNKKEKKMVNLLNRFPKLAKQHFAFWGFHPGHSQSVTPLFEITNFSLISLFYLFSNHARSKAPSRSKQITSGIHEAVAVILRCWRWTQFPLFPFHFVS